MGLESPIDMVHCATFFTTLVATRAFTYCTPEKFEIFHFVFSRVIARQALVSFEFWRAEMYTSAYMNEKIQSRVHVASRKKRV